MKKGRRWWSFEATIKVAAVTLTVMVTFLCSRFVSDVRSNLWKSSINTMMESTTQACNLVEGKIENEYAALELWKGTLRRWDFSDEDSIQYLLEEFSSDNSPVYLVAGPREALIREPVNEEEKASRLRLYPKGIKLSEEEFNRLCIGKDYGITEPHTSRNNGKRVMSAFVYIDFSDGNAGYLVKEVPMDDLKKAFSVSFYQNQGYAYVINRAGEVLAGHDIKEKDAFNLLERLEMESGNDVDELNLVYNMMTKEKSEWFSFLYEGEKDIFCLVPIDNTEWYMVSVIPEASIAAQTDAILSATFILVIAILCSFVILITMLLLREYQNKKKLEQENLLERRMIVASAAEINTVLLGVNLTEDTYKLVFDNRHTKVKYDTYSSYSDMIEACVAAADYPYQEAFRYAFSLEHLRNALTHEKPNVYLEVQTFLDGQMHWLAVEAVLVDNFDGIQRAIYSVRFIDEVKAQDEKRRETLATALAMAEQANKAQVAFLNNMSHDIRTPMNGIVGMTALAKVHLGDKERVEDCLNKIEGASQHLLALINDILDVSRMESGKFSLSMEPFSMEELIQNTIDMVTPQLRERGHMLRVNKEGILHQEVVGDRLRLQQVYLNILSNAVKYTSNGGEIALTFSEEKAGMHGFADYVFVCKDNGCGMKPEFVERLFEPFAREDNEKVENEQGTGLGMVIVKNVIRMMGGDIQVESRPNEGTEITITVSLKTVLSQEEEETTEGTDDLLLLLNSDFSGSRILLAEDNVMNREIAEEILSMTGATVDAVNNGQEAYENYRNHKENYYDLIFMDIRMPVMDGYAATRAIRRADRSDSDTVPIIAMSANAFSDDMKFSKQSGMNGHISKPVDFAQLLSVLNHFLKGQIRENDGTFDEKMIE